MQQKEVFDILKPNVIQYISNFLSPEDIIRLSSVNKKTNRVLKENNPLVWRYKLQQHFPTVYWNMPSRYNINWFETFKLIYIKQYRNLDPLIRSVFSILKEKQNTDQEIERLKKSIQFQPENSMNLLEEFTTFLKEKFLAKKKISKVEDLFSLCDSNNNSLMFWIAWTQNQVFMNYIYETLIVPKYSKGISLDVHKQDEQGATILHWAVTFNQSKDYIYVLIKQGSNVEHLNKVGETALHLTAKYNYADLAQILLDNGADPMRKCQYGRTPLYVASGWGSFQVVQLLLNKKSAIDEPSHNGATPLLVASAYGHISTVKFLLDKGADVNHACNDGSTPIYSAAEKGYRGVVMILLKNNADINKCCQCDAGNLKPAEIAFTNGHKEIGYFLYQKHLLEYIKEEKWNNDEYYNTRFSFFGSQSNLVCSAVSKEKASLSLLNVIQGKDDPSMLDDHQNALSHGILGEIYTKLLPLLEDIQKKKKQIKSYQISFGI